jgi:hypothetical protein
MTASAASAEHRASLRAIDAHFAGRVSPEAERAMRAHLPDCALCRRRYERQLLLVRLDPSAPSDQERIGRGLDFRSGRAEVRSQRIVHFVVAAAALAAITLLWLQTRGPDMLVARGAEIGAPRTQLFWTYRVRANAALELAADAIDPGDELAFAYSNPAGKHYIMIFGVDEHSHVYWFHPGWAAGEPAPFASPAAIGPGPHELAGAVRHAFDGQRLQLYALFCERRLDAQTVEAWLGHADPPAALDTLDPSAVLVQRRLRLGVQR